MNPGSCLRWASACPVAAVKHHFGRGIGVDADELGKALQKTDFGQTPAAAWANQNHSGHRVAFLILECIMPVAQKIFDTTTEICPGPVAAKQGLGMPKQAAAIGEQGHFRYSASQTKI